MRTVHRACGKQDWKKRKCEFLDTNPYKQNYAKQLPKAEKMLDLAAHIGTLLETFENINNQDFTCIGSKGNLNQILEYTRGILTRKNLSACQKACVTKCVTANYITYQLGLDSWESPCEVANSGKGKCVGFANMGDHLMDNIGLRSKSVANQGHAYNKVWLNGHWYYSEPQDGNCRFFRK